MREGVRVARYIPSDQRSQQCLQRIYGTLSLRSQNMSRPRTSRTLPPSHLDILVDRGSQDIGMMVGNWCHRMITM